MEKMRTVYKISVGKPEGRRPICRASGGWKDDNNKMELKEIGCGLDLSGSG